MRRIAGCPCGAAIGLLGLLGRRAAQMAAGITGLWPVLVRRDVLRLKPYCGTNDERAEGWQADDAL